MLRRRKAGISPSCVTNQCFRDSTQADAHEVDIGTFLCCSCDCLQIQCTRFNIQTWGHPVPASLPSRPKQQNVAGTQFCSRNKTFLQEQEENCRCNVPPLHVHPTWALVCADLKGTYKQDLCLQVLLLSRWWWLKLFIFIITIIIF